MQQRNIAKQFAFHTGTGLLGGVLYGCLEIIWRGFTHISMVMLGGLCFWVLVLLHRMRCALWVKCLAGGLCITALELAAGCVLNLWWRLDVWDYQAQRLQLLGQICMKYSLLWCGLSSGVMGVMHGVQRVRLRLLEPGKAIRFKKAA